MHYGVDPSCISPTVIQISKLDGLGVEVLFHHQRHLKGDGMLEFAQIQAGQLADLFQTVYERVSVYEQLSGGFGLIEVVL